VLPLVEVTELKGVVEGVADMLRRESEWQCDCRLMAIAGPVQGAAVVH
jgi:hypothetical protein